MLRAHHTELLDDLGRQVVHHGINLISKGARGAGAGHPSFRGSWTEADLDFLADELGVTLVRFGLIWAAAAPAPHTWDEEYLAWVGDQLDLLHARGIEVVLDGHQDLYSQLYSDGAPAWATLTQQDFAAEALWSDGYLNSPAVHEALDAFWSNQPVDGVGLQDHLIELWVELVRQFGSHPAVVGIDVLNEPTPGALAPQLAGMLLGTFAELTGQDLDQVLSDHADEESKFAQLQRLEDVAVHWAMGDAVAPVMAEFEQVVQQFYDKAWAALRRAGFEGLLLREHCYFANTGVPVHLDLVGDQVTYSPHGYDLVVDTQAQPLASNVRAETIFTRVRENQLRWHLPVIVGEWGALGSMAGVSSHGEFLLDLFDRFGWSHTYWCWEDDFDQTEAAQVLHRVRPQRIDGRLQAFGRAGEHFEATWQGAGQAESLLWLRRDDASVEVVSVDDAGEQRPVEFVREGRLVTVAPSAGVVSFKAEW